MAQKEISCNLPKEIVVPKIQSFLKELSRLYIFNEIDCNWKKSKVSVGYILRGRTEKDIIEISLSNKEEKTRILVRGIKSLSVEYFFLELAKIFKEN